MKRLTPLLVFAALLIVVLSAPVTPTGPPVGGDFDRAAGDNSTLYLPNVYEMLFTDPTSGDTIRAFVLLDNRYVAIADTSDAGLQALINALVDSREKNADSVQQINMLGAPAALGDIMYYNSIQGAWIFDSLDVFYLKSQINAPSAGDLLAWISGTWQPWTLAVDSTSIANGAIGLEDIEQGGASSGQVLEWNGSRWAPATDNTGGGTGDSALYLARTAGGTNLVKWYNYGVWFYYDVGSYVDSAGFYIDTTGGSAKFVIDGPGDTTFASLFKNDTIIISGDKIWDFAGTDLSVSGGALNLDVEGIGIDFENTSWPYGVQDMDFEDTTSILSAGRTYATVAPNVRTIMKWADSTFIKDQGTDTLYTALTVANPGSINMNNRGLTNPLDPADATGVGDRGYNDGRYVNDDGDALTGTFTLTGGSLTGADRMTGDSVGGTLAIYLPGDNMSGWTDSISDRWFDDFAYDAQQRVINLRIDSIADTLGSRRYDDTTWTPADDINRIVWGSEKDTSSIAEMIVVNDTGNVRMDLRSINDRAVGMFFQNSIQRWMMKVNSTSGEWILRSSTESADYMRVDTLGNVKFDPATQLVLPGGADPATDTAQAIAVDTDDDALELNSDGTARLIPTIQQVGFTVYSPGDVDDTVTIFTVGNYHAPHGVTLVNITVGVNDTSGTYELQFEEWTTTSSDRARSAYIDTLTVLNDAYEQSSQTFTDGTIAAGNQIRIIIPSTTEDEIYGRIEYYVNPGN